MKKILVTITFLIFSLAVMAQTPITLYRYFKASTNRHFYTTNINELGPGGSNGWAREGDVGMLYQAPFASGMLPVYRFYSVAMDAHYYANYQSAPSGFYLEGVIGYSPASFDLSPTNKIPVKEYRCGNDYFYTSINEGGGCTLIRSEAFLVAKYYNN